MVTRALPIAAALLVASVSSAARADGDGAVDEPQAPPRQHADKAPGSLPVPRVHHAPVASARVHEELSLTVTIQHPELVRSATVVYRGARPGLRAVQLQRRGTEEYVATISADEVTSAGIAYAIEIERVDGSRFTAFAARDDLHPVLVMEERMTARERSLLNRLGGRRSVVTAMSELVRFGATTGDRAIPCAPKQDGCPVGQSRVPSVNDQYWRVEAGYTYRFLRTIAEFGLKIGVVRGSSLVDTPQLDEAKYKVGLNYGSPWVRFRFADAWHAELSLLTSITEVGFSFGGGSSLIIGDPYGTRFTMGAEAIGVQKSTYFGSRFFVRMDILAHERVILAPVIEVTDMPHAESFGVRLYGDVVFSLPRGFGISVRGGYQARRSTSGGVAAGGSLSYSF
jgi:hypothetical protein